MQNLVLKNPILRFKLGRNIKKFENPSGPIEKKSYKSNYDRNYTGGGLKIINWFSDLFNSPQLTTRIGMNGKPIIDNYSLKNVTTPTKTRTVVFPEEVDPNYTHNFLEALRAGYRPNPDGSWKASSKSENVVTNNNSNPVTKSLSARKTPVTKFKGTVVGRLVLARGNNLSNVISNDLRALLINSGAFNDTDFSDVRAFQNALNRYFAKDGYGSILSDNKWGNQTATAFLEALRKTKSPIVNTLDGVLILNGKTAKDLANDAYFFDIRKTTSPIITQTPTITNLPTKPTRSRNYNKSLIRNLISLGGFDPYKYTGALRKALRLYLNGESDDTSLLDGTDLARFTLPFRKQGGQLVSKNPINRFKNKLK